MRTWMPVIGALGVSMSSCMGAHSATAPRYVSSDDLSEIVVEGGELKIRPKNERVPPGRLDGGGWAANIRDCSNEQFKCLNADRFTFAVVRTGLHVGDRYQLNGVKFSVTGCGDEACRVQDIRSVCENWNDDDSGQCSPFRAYQAGKAAAIVLTYKYSADIGVTEIAIEYQGFPPDPRQVYKLSSETGILR